MDRLRTSFAQVGREIVVPLIGALIIVIAGYLLARLLERLIRHALERIRFNELLARGGVLEAVERTGTHLNPTRVVAGLFFWLVMFAVILTAANALGLEGLESVLGELVSYVPSVIAALVIILLGILLGGFVATLILASAGAIHGAAALARLGRAGVIVLAVFMALQELGIATNIVTTAFAILFGTVALAAALAFGLGSRELAGEVMREWYERYRREREQIERAQAESEWAEEVQLPSERDLRP